MAILMAPVDIIIKLFVRIQNTILRWSIAVLACVILALPSQAASPPLALPDGFMYLSKAEPTIQQDIRYFTAYNFLGRPVPGYLAPTCIVTVPTAIALRQVQADLAPFGLSLKVYDCYRPQTAVNAFVAWGNDLNDQTTKAAFYPNLDKRDLFRLGYIAEKSSHSRGSTVDLTIVVLSQTATKTENSSKNLNLAMGTSFDYFDQAAHTFNSTLPGPIRANRLLLKSLMEKHGFTNLLEEWWHFTLTQEPFKTTYFDFPVQ